MIKKNDQWQLKDFNKAKHLKGGAAFFAWRQYEQGVLTNFLPTYEQEFTTDVQAGPDYGYGSDNIGTLSNIN